MKPVVLASLLALSVVVLSALSGCGQKGPLYLPGQNPNPPKPLLDHPSSQSSSDASSTPTESVNDKANGGNDSQMSTPDQSNNPE